MPTPATNDVFRFTSDGLTAQDRTVTEFEFIKWRSDRRAFFLRNESGSLVVATPELPRLAEDWEFPKPPFPESAVVAVRPYRLVPPPVKADPSAPPAARWEDLYERQHHLCPTPEDQPALQKLLDQENAARREAYRDRVDPKHLKQEWARLKGGERAQAKRQPGFKQFCQQSRQLLDERGLNRDLTMEDLLRNPEGAVGDDGRNCSNAGVGDALLRKPAGILGDYLRQRWAGQMGINLEDIGYVDPARPCEGWRSAPARFLAWMRAHCPAISRPLSPEEAERSLHLALDDPPSQSFPETFTEIELLATVRYVAEFKNGPRVFLAGLVTREPRADELRELKNMGQVASRAPQPRARGSAVSAEELAKWPELIGAKELIRLGVGGKNRVHDAAAKLGLAPVNRAAKQKKYRRAEVLTKLGPKHPRGTLGDI